jgi:hypothetical protein
MEKKYQISNDGFDKNLKTNFNSCYVIIALCSSKWIERHILWIDRHFGLRANLWIDRQSTCLVILNSSKYADKFGYFY